MNILQHFLSPSHLYKSKLSYGLQPHSIQPLTTCQFLHYYLFWKF